MITCTADSGRCAQRAVLEVEYLHQGMVFTRFLCEQHRGLLQGLRQNAEVSYEGALRIATQATHDTPPPPPTGAAAGERVYVVFKRERAPSGDYEFGPVELLGVTRNLRDAKLWKLGNPQTNGYQTFTLDHMPWDEEDEPAQPAQPAAAKEDATC